MGGHQGSTPKLRKRAKPTDLYCRDCLEQVVFLEISERSHYSDLPYFCESCRRRWMRSQVLIFDEMTEAKFERVRQRNINILKGDMRP